MRWIKPTAHMIEVRKANDKAHYNGLVVCGSVWHCPICAAKITERRRAEILQAMATWREHGGQVIMITQTLPHYLQQRVQDVLTGFSKARKLMRNRKPWKALARRIQIQGTIRGLEVTHGANGWHVHAHELLFIPGGVTLDLEGLQEEILIMWQEACSTAWGYIPNGHGISVDNGDKAGKYASKWGLDCELTKGHIKHGRDQNYTPWDLLRRAYAGDLDAVILFNEYAKAFKGKRQLVWTEGLRKLLGLQAELSDQELAEKIEEGSELLGLLSWGDWKKVLRADLRGELLEVATKSGWPGVMQLIRSLYMGETNASNQRAKRRSQDDGSIHGHSNLQSGRMSSCDLGTHQSGRTHHLPERGYSEAARDSRP